MKAFGYFLTTLLGISCTSFDISVRLKEYDLAWPLEWGYSGRREDTIWAIREHAYQDVSLAILTFGLLQLAIVLFHWLQAKSTDNKQGA